MFALPIVSKVLEVSRTVRALGWAAALEVLDGTWSGWRADFLVAGLVLVAEFERDATMLEQAALWRSSLMGRAPTDG